MCVWLKHHRVLQSVSILAVVGVMSKLSEGSLAILNCNETHAHTVRIECTKSVN